ncbi:unnamed protein product [Cochlearia groenlandica]
MMLSLDTLHTGNEAIVGRIAIVVGWLVAALIDSLKRSIPPLLIDDFLFVSIRRWKFKEVLVVFAMLKIEEANHRRCLSRAMSEIKASQRCYQSHCCRKLKGHKSSSKPLIPRHKPTTGSIGASGARDETVNIR